MVGHIVLFPIDRGRLFCCCCCSIIEEGWAPLAEQRRLTEIRESSWRCGRKRVGQFHQALHGHVHIYLQRLLQPFQKL